MAVKEIFRRMRPVQLYVMLALTALFFMTELVVSHVTHALTLLVDSYHMLCNLIALIGCIATVKYGGGGSEEGIEERIHQTCSKESISGEELKSDPHPDGGGRRCEAAAEGVSEGCMSVGGCHGHFKASVETLPGKHKHNNPLVSERRLRNTFGWARIDVLVLMSGTVFLASLCFSLVVEALQTLCHIGHSDEMHHPIPVMCIGAAGILLNGLCYLLIGGYTFHQGSFLHVTSTGDVVLERAVPQDTVRQSKRGGNPATLKKNENVPAIEPSVVNEVSNTPLSPSAIYPAPPLTQPSQAAVATSYLQAGISGTPPLRQGPREMFRDVIGCVLVIVCSLTVWFTDASVAKYADPIISIFSAVLLLVLSYPYMKESGLILLQTIPDHINIESLRSRLCKAFAPVVVGVHDLHIWQLTPQKTYATAHVVFINSKGISPVMKQVTEFFHEQGINHVTIQPEFLRCRAISFQNEESSGFAPVEGVIETSGKNEKCKSYTIMMGNEHQKNGEGVICFLQCAGRGGSCRNLHCCDEAKGEPLALPHHHHHNHARYRRRLSLDDDVLEQVVSNPASSSSPNLNIKQRTPAIEEVSCNRRAVSEETLEKSCSLLKKAPKSDTEVNEETTFIEKGTNIFIDNEMSEIVLKEIDLQVGSDEDEQRLVPIKEESRTVMKEEVSETNVKGEESAEAGLKKRESSIIITEDEGRTESTENNHLQSVSISS